MNKFKKLASIALAVSIIGGNLCFAQAANTAPVYMNSGNVTNVIQADAKSERIPAGTSFKLRLETPVNSYNTTIGDTFRAVLLEDVRIGTKVVIPAGTLVRGRAGEVKKNSYLSRGGILNLTFDHVVTSMGKQLPLTVKVTNSKYLTGDGSLAAGGGYLNAVGKNIDQGCDFLVNSTQKGIDIGKSFWQGYPVILTVPAGAAVGLAGAGGIFAVKSTVALFKKGENVRLVPGDVIEITLKDALDVPLY
jgi:hypothetical protein